MDGRLSPQLTKSPLLPSGYRNPPWTYHRNITSRHRIRTPGTGRGYSIYIWRKFTATHDIESLPRITLIRNKPIEVRTCRNRRMAHSQIQARLNRT